MRVNLENINFYYSPPQKPPRPTSFASERKLSSVPPITQFFWFPLSPEPPAEHPLKPPFKPPLPAVTAIPSSGADDGPQPRLTSLESGCQSTAASWNVFGVERASLSTTTTCPLQDELSVPKSCYPLGEIAHNPSSPGDNSMPTAAPIPIASDLRQSITRTDLHETAGSESNVDQQHLSSLAERVQSATSTSSLELLQKAESLPRQILTQEKQDCSLRTSRATVEQADISSSNTSRDTSQDGPNLALGEPNHML
ncbi:hypothetical protein VTN00DRAFT_2012 [Thermoascus crustaceus]|uniref:uncharacterized protein n=1 Tax=Thermoascus crustaceus TaxID=5088 RepID=UPI0037421EEE